MGTSIPAWIRSPPVAPVLNTCVVHFCLTVVYFVNLYCFCTALDVSATNKGPDSNQQEELLLLAKP